MSAAELLGKLGQILDGEELQFQPVDPDDPDRQVRRPRRGKESQIRAIGHHRRVRDKGAYKRTTRRIDLHRADALERQAKKRRVEANRAETLRRKEAK